jgi:hypothetical protein
VSQFFIQQLDLVVSVLQLWPQSTKNLYSAWQGSSAVAGTTYAVSDNGWMQTNVFVSWFDTFLRQVKERPFLLVFDGHRTQILHQRLAMLHHQILVGLLQYYHQQACHSVNLFLFPSFKIHIVKCQKCDF